jgi:hypothetical protein
MKTIQFNRETADLCIDIHRRKLSSLGLSTSVTIGKPWCEGAQDTVTIKVGADWFGSVSIILEHDCEIWTLTIKNDVRLGRMSETAFDEQMNALAKIQALIREIKSRLG